MEGSEGTWVCEQAAEADTPGEAAERGLGELRGRENREEAGQAARQPL